MRSLRHLSAATCGYQQEENGEKLWDLSCHRTERDTRLAEDLSDSFHCQQRVPGPLALSPEHISRMQLSTHLMSRNPLGGLTQRGYKPFVKYSKHRYRTANFACDVCGQVFSDLNGCRRHKRMHQDYSQFRHKCPICSKKFYRKDALSSHLRHGHKLGKHALTGTVHSLHKSDAQ